MSNGSASESRLSWRSVLPSSLVTDTLGNRCFVTSCVAGKLPTSKFNCGLKLLTVPAMSGAIDINCFSDGRGSL